MKLNRIKSLCTVGPHIHCLTIWYVCTTSMSANFAKSRHDQEHYLPHALERQGGEEPGRSREASSSSETFELTLARHGLRLLFIPICVLPECNSKSRTSVAEMGGLSGELCWRWIYCHTGHRCFCLFTTKVQATNTTIKQAFLLSRNNHSDSSKGEMT